MPLETKLFIVVGLLAAATAAGLFWRARTGRAKAITGGETVNLTELAAVKDGEPVTQFGKKVTFLQFSSEFCTMCRQTAKLYSALESVHDDVLHIEVDITDRLDLAKKYNILQTPTTLVLDSKGRITSRIAGAAKAQTINEELGSFDI